MTILRSVFLSCALLVAALALSGCAASGAKFSAVTAVPAGSVQVVLYRTEAFLDGAVAWRVDLNGQKVATLRNGGFAVISAPPGAALFELKADSLFNAPSFRNLSLPMTLETDSRVFIRASVKLDSVIPAFAYVGRTRMFSPVPSETGLQEVRGLSQSE